MKGTKRFAPSDSASDPNDTAVSFFPFLSLFWMNYELVYTQMSLISIPRGFIDAGLNNVQLTLVSLFVLICGLVTVDFSLFEKFI